MWSCWAFSGNPVPPLPPIVPPVFVCAGKEPTTVKGIYLLSIGCRLPEGCMVAMCGEIFPMSHAGGDPCPLPPPGAWGGAWVLTCPVRHG